jgi:hypothetical protein
MDKPLVTVIAGRVPGRVEKIEVRQGATAEEALRQVGFSCDVSSVRLFKNGRPTQRNTIVKGGDVILLAASIKGTGIEYRTSERIVTYFRGGKGVSARRKRIHDFLLRLNADGKDVVEIEEVDVKGRSGFAQKAAALDHHDASLVVDQKRDILHPVLLPWVGKVPVFIVDLFRGPPLVDHGRPAVEHIVEVQKMAWEHAVASQPKRTRSEYDEERKEARDARNVDLWRKVKEIMGVLDKKGNWSTTGKEIVGRLHEEYNIKITASRLTQRLSRLAVDESGRPIDAKMELRNMKAENKVKPL